MKLFIKHITIVFLAFLAVLSTCSFTINEHYCGGQNVSVSVGVDAEDCGMENAQDDVLETTLHKTPCCKDISTLIAGQDELPSHYETLSFSAQQFITVFQYTYQLLFITSEKQQHGFHDYVPPPLIRDIYILDESFLI